MRELFILPDFSAVASRYNHIQLLHTPVTTRSAPPPPNFPSSIPLLGLPTKLESDDYYPGYSDSERRPFGDLSFTRLFYYTAHSRTRRDNVACSRRANTFHPQPL